MDAKTADKQIKPVNVWMDGHHIGVANQIITNSTGDYYGEDGEYLADNGEYIPVGGKGVLVNIDPTRLTREQASALVGEEYVDKVERMNCEYYSHDEIDKSQVWSVGIYIEGLQASLTIYYKPIKDAEFDRIHEMFGDDLSNIDWEIDYYEVV